MEAEQKLRKIRNDEITSHMVFFLFFVLLLRQFLHIAHGHLELELIPSLTAGNWYFRHNNSAKHLH